jgi:3-methyladenine DNA glycosylase/8-oxoguanine DNA glycosylase
MEAVAVGLPWESVWRAGRPVDIGRTLGTLVRGSGDPAHRVGADGTFWRAALTPEGPATLALRLAGRGEVAAAAWGPGAEWALAGVPDLLGGRDDPCGFVPDHPLLRDAVRRYPGLRVPRTGLVFDALVPAVLEQKVTGREAWRSWRDLVRRFGSAAPGAAARTAGEPALAGPVPRGLRVPPAAADLLALPTWAWHRAGVDLRRQRTLRAAAAVADRLEECTALPPEAALARLRVVPGVGVWTAAEVAQRALGDADAVSVGDYHIPSLVGWALAGAPTDDDGMLALLEPYCPHRHRVVRLIEVSGAGLPPRRGPRMAARDYRRI